jgi:hypothetical protein
MIALAAFTFAGIRYMQRFALSMRYANRCGELRATYLQMAADSDDFARNLQAKFEAFAAEASGDSASSLLAREYSRSLDEVRGESDYCRQRAESCLQLQRAYQRVAYRFWEPEPSPP